MKGRYVGKPSAKRLRVMVSSAVYGYEELLDQVFAVLSTYGFDVWMSHKGTFPIAPDLTAFDNCLEAVKQCDVFLGIITGRYGSGRSGQERSSTHREIIEAVRIEKPRFFLVHEHVVVARQLLNQFRTDRNGKPRRYTFFKKTAIFEDIRVLDMYDVAIMADLPLSERKGNWVQQYRDREDILRFIEAQFGDVTRIKEFLEKADKYATAATKHK